MAGRAEDDGRYGSMVLVPSVAGWWAGRSDPQRIALYTRSSYYSVLALTPFLAFLVVGSAPGTPAVAALLFVLGSIVVTVATLVLVRAGLTRSPADERLPTRQLLGAWAAALATGGVGVAAVPDGGQAGSVVPWVVALAPTMVLIACSTGWSALTLTVGGAGIGVLVGAVLAVVGRPPGEALVLGVVFGLTSTATALSFRFSVWVLDVVTQLERAQEVQARLAVAEERLRFARDLHDVMGRNLSAIAVTGQLAAELVRRGRTEAADELADISRIADDSLREIRGVVSGYRTASLPGELAGARSLLHAAGISCTVTGEEEATSLPVPAQIALGWVVREAVTNVLRHSEATACAISLTAGGATAELRVVNDGAGDRAGPVDRQRGSGLTGLAERLDARGGRLAAVHGDGRFELTATLPVAVPA